MAVKIVTDSSADIPAEITKDLNITVVPLYVRFGEQLYRDRIDINEDDFFQRLTTDSIHPSTTQPSPNDFIEAYQNLAKDADGIVSLHISSKLSGTYNSALQAKDEVKGCPIAVFDSKVLTMALGLVVIAAAKMAKNGASYDDIVQYVEKTLPNAHLLGLLDTLKYVLLGGRIGKATALLGSILNVKPLLSLKDGEVIPAGQARSRGKGIERLVEFVKDYNNVEAFSVVYSTTPDEAKTLIERIVTEKTISRDKIILSRLGPMLGVHIGPGAVVVAYIGKIA